MHSPFALILLIDHFLPLVSVAQELPSAPLNLIPTSVQYSPNPLSVLSRPVCPASGILKAPDHHPWSETPTCLTVNGEAEERTYCIHTSTTFSKGRGISILTSPNIGASIANSPAFQSTSHETASSSPPFEVKKIPGRGRGLVANRTILFGQAISHYAPLLVVDREFLNAAGGIQARQRSFLIREALSKLPKASQALFFEQCTRACDSLPSRSLSDLGAEIEDILATNSFMGLFSPATTSASASDSRKVEGQAKPHAVNIPGSSLLNHDCRPNTVAAFDPLTLTHKLYAVTTISPGDEITLTYITLFDSFETRQADLLQHWGFRCSCSLCSRPAEERNQSDARLTLLRQYRKYLTDWSYESQGTPELALEYLELLEAEGLHIHIGEAHVIATLRFSAWEDETAVRAHALRAVETGLWLDPRERKVVEEMERLAQDCKSHWSWGFAKHFRVVQDGTAPILQYVDD